MVGKTGGHNRVHDLTSPDPLSAYDAAEDIIHNGKATVETKVSAVLALARGGATELALRRFDDYGLAEVSDNEDALALLGRLLKDKAEALPDVSRAATLVQSAEAYRQAWELTDGYYSGINAATLYSLAGRPDVGQNIAQKVLTRAGNVPIDEGMEARYFREATVAEALLLLNRDDQARTALAIAMQTDPDNYVAHASTLNQFQRILDFRSEAAGWLDAFRPPATCFYTGRIRGLPVEGAVTDELAGIIAAFLDARQIGSAYGALAAGSDILFAEAILERGGTLNVLLPCQRQTFEAHSVAPYGDAWVTRYRHCLSSATHVAEATSDDTLMGEVAVDLAARISMGQSIEAARMFATRAVQVIIQPRPGGLSARSADIWAGSNRGFETVTLMTSRSTPDEDSAPVKKLEQSDRQLAAMLFADLTGFGQLRDADVRTVLDLVLKPLSEVLEESDPALIHLDSWGDAMFAVFADTGSAAQTARALQKKMRAVDLEAHGLPSTLALRIGAHFGPVMRVTDPLTGRVGVFGSQVSYAARIEPIAVPGSILASEAFASALALTPKGIATSHYVGRQSLKGISEPVRLFSIS